MKFICLHDDDVKCLCLVDRDMGARHRARASTIQIIRVEVVEASKTRRPNIKQFHVSTGVCSAAVSKYHFKMHNEYHFNMYCKDLKSLG